MMCSMNNKFDEKFDVKLDEQKSDSNLKYDQINTKFDEKFDEQNDKIKINFNEMKDEIKRENFKLDKRMMKCIHISSKRKKK